MSVKKIPFPKFKKIYSTVPRLCVEVVCVKRNRILLTRRTIAPAIGDWHTPGGTVLKGENLEEAVQRVGKEELGIQVRVKKFLGIIEYVSYKNHYSQDISLAYLVSADSEASFDLDGHADKCDFFSELPQNTILEQKNFYNSVLKIPISKTKCV